ncbi:PilT/PilU family type 4a pilus ATPase [Sulfurirhabdus autotrophica]|uniref:Twitching motility protein PilU n=1 Tax=Sulfurirhabdus autotrophica TaxID=1706046 RepID=A0A4R3YGT7_9PROT|nr:PilT/PilU family type 4a pilus ATPase [Sulfurirhabdus autotrophica]TCV90458.1 twitching motility protein PilU [Sulfurirhabdus autotrophica]
MADIKVLLKMMLEFGASDLFLTAGTTPHFKIDGATRPANVPALKPGESTQLVYELMNQQQRHEFETAKECNFALTLDGEARFRVNVYYQRGEVSAVIRLIKSVIPSFEKLGLPEQAKVLSLLKRGLVLMVGAAGSGKSTTMAAMVAYRAKMMEGHILTIEDPIEFLFSHDRSIVEQREVGLDTLSFGDALRNAMREAPDVIVIGEIRDRLTAQNAIMYAEAGVLCISTMHANNANQAVDRIINFFPEEAHKQVLLDLSLNLKGVISQRLLPGLNGKQVLATEILLQSAYVTDMIQKGQTHTLKDAIKKGADVGMQIFDDSLYTLYKEGRISKEEAISNADSHTDLALRIRLT